MARASSSIALLALIAVSAVAGVDLPVDLPTGGLPTGGLPTGGNGPVVNTLVNGLLPGLKPLVDVPQLVNSLNLGTGSATAAKTPVPAPAPAPASKDAADGAVSSVTGRKLSELPDLPTGGLPTGGNGPVVNTLVNGLLPGLKPLVDVPQLVNSLNLGTGSATAAMVPVPAPAPAPATRGSSYGRKMLANDATVDASAGGAADASVGANLPDLPTGGLPTGGNGPVVNTLVNGLLPGLKPLVDVPQLVNSLNLGTGSATAAKVPVPAPAPGPARG